METKNSIIITYVNSLLNEVITLSNNSKLLGDNIDENKAIISIIDINIVSIKSQLTVLQNALDNYEV